MFISNVLDELNKQYPIVIEEGKLISWEIIEVYSVYIDTPLPSPVNEHNNTNTKNIENPFSYSLMVNTQTCIHNIYYLTLYQGLSNRIF
jgi:hypothetical protein